MKNIQNLILIFFILISTQGMCQFFEYNNHLFSSKIALQDSSKKVGYGLDMGINSKYLSDKSVEIAAIYNVYNNKQKINSLSIISNLKSYFNNSFYIDNSSVEGERIDIAKDGYDISFGLIYQFSKNNFKFSYGIAPVFSNFYQKTNSEIGFSSTLLLEYKRIMFITNLVANQFIKNSYYSPYSAVSVASYFSSAFFFKLNPNSDERVYLKIFNSTSPESNKIAIGFSIPIKNIVLINPEIAHDISDSRYVSETLEHRLYYGLLTKVKINNIYLKSFVTYHKDSRNEDLNINLGIEYYL